MEQKRRIRVLIAKPGLDGHDRGAKIIARALRDAGMEVIYTGIRQTSEAIVAAAIEESVDVVGLSILSGAHKGLIPPIIEALKRKGEGDILVIAGGIIPEEDHLFLQEAGFRGAIFGPGTFTMDVAKYIEREVAGKVK